MPQYAPMARNYAAARLMADIGLRVREARLLDLDDVKWHLGPFGKVHVRFGKGARGSGPASGWFLCSTARTGRCGGSSRTCGRSSAVTIPAQQLRCSRPSALAPTGTGHGWGMTRCGSGSLTPSAPIFLSGRIGFRHMCCGTTVPRGST